MWVLRHGESVKMIRIYNQMEALQLAIALRNRLAHGYDEDINDDLIWITVSNSIPDLLSEVQSRLKEL